MIDISWIKTKEELEKWLKQEAEDLLRKELAKKDQETQELAYKDKGVVYSGPDFTQKGTEEEIEKRKDFGSLFGLNRAQAEAHAKENGWLTLETTEIGRAIEEAGLDKKFGDGTTWNAFSSLSKVYAEELAGDVKAFVQGANHEAKSNV